MMSIIKKGNRDHGCLFEEKYLLFFLKVSVLLIPIFH